MALPTGLFRRGGANSSFPGSQWQLRRASGDTVAPMTNVLLTASSYPRSADDWQGIFIRRIADALAGSPETTLRVWAPPGPLHPNAESAIGSAGSRFLERLGAEGVAVPWKTQKEGADEEDEEDEDFGETLGLQCLFLDVHTRLADGALLGTDGSKVDGDGTSSPADPNSYSQISAFRGRRDIIPADAMNQAESFRGPLGHTFECVGCINQMRRYDKGPVLIWQVGSP